MAGMKGKNAGLTAEEIAIVERRDARLRVRARVVGALNTLAGDPTMDHADTFVKMWDAYAAHVGSDVKIAVVRPAPQEKTKK